MVVAPLAAASNANEFSSMPKAFTVRSESNGVGDANRTATRRTLARVVDAEQAEQAVRADRHRAQAVGEHEVEPAARAASMSKWCAAQSPDTSA